MMEYITITADVYWAAYLPLGKYVGPMLTHAGIVLGTFYLLWVHFLAVMHLQEKLSKMTKPAIFLGRITLFFGLLLDLFWQLIPASILWLELPKETTVSGRVARLCKNGHGYRYNLAVWFKDNWLALFDSSGGHGEVSAVTREDSVRGPNSP